jgi:hypothetical protein
MRLESLHACAGRSGLCLRGRDLQAWKWCEPAVRLLSLLLRNETRFLPEALRGRATSGAHTGSVIRARTSSGIVRSTPA